MFYLSKDKKIVMDSFGDKVGFLQDGKFSQILKQKNKNLIFADSRYENGLSPMEMEQVSELLQTQKIK